MDRGGSDDRGHPGRWARPRRARRRRPSPVARAGGPDPVERRSRILWVLAGLLTVAVVAAALMTETGGGFESGSPVLAWDACRGEVLGRLREPATAVFPPRTTATVQDRDPVWTVTSYVDADNAFGELARERWRCTVEFGPSGAQLVELELTPVVTD